MVLFFYYYLADVTLELLLISNIIPSSSSIYKVFQKIILSGQIRYFINLVFCGTARRNNLCNMSNINDEWFREFSMGRRWNEHICLGKIEYNSLYFFYLIILIRVFESFL